MAYFDNLDDYQAARESGLYGADGKPLVGPGLTRKTVEIVRSVAFKLNLGNYQSMDFFVSQKASCDSSEVDTVSADLYDWCFDQVMQSVKEVQEKQAKKQAVIAAKSRSAA